MLDRVKEIGKKAHTSIVVVEKVEVGHEADARLATEVYRPAPRLGDGKSPGTQLPLIRHHALRRRGFIPIRGEGSQRV